MSPSPLAQVEAITQAMLAEARRENMPALDALESQRRTLLANISPAELVNAGNRPTLQRIVETNQHVIDQLASRRDDIALLLRALGPGDPGHPG